MALFDKLNENAFFQKAKQATGKATKIAVDSVKSSYTQTQNLLEEKKEKRRLSKLPQEGGIKRYEVKYRGGLPGYPSEKEVSKHPMIYMDVMQDRFSFLPKEKSEAWFAGVEIPYRRVVSLDIVERMVNTAETIVGIGRENLDFRQRNMLELTYRAEDGEEYIMRCEMATGFTTVAEARVCMELMDLLRTNKILKQFIGRAEPAAPLQPENTDVIQQLRDYKALMDCGVITQEEFELKKKQLLGI